MKNILVNRYVYHSLIWIIILISFSFIIVSQENDVDFSTVVFQTIFLFFPIMLCIYIVFALIDRLFAKMKYLLLIILSTLTIVVVSTISYLLSKIWPYFQVSFLQEIINISSLVILAIGLRYFKRGIVGQFHLQELKSKTKEAELNALKAQINPHFLFNTLNNVYALNQIDSTRGSEMLIELSEVMRYHLKISKEDKVALGDEVQLLKSYVELEKLRLTESCTLELNIGVIPESWEVAPLILLPFTENAFKHGTHPIKNSFVTINISVIDKQKFIFNIENSIIENKNIEKTHIGLENVKRRLELVYGEKHHLSISKKDGVFNITLEIDL